MKTKKDQKERRKVIIVGNDGFSALKITAEIASSGYDSTAMTGQKRKLSRLLHAAVVEMGYNPLDINFAKGTSK